MSGEVSSPFHLVLDSIVVSHHGRFVIFISKNESQIVLVACSREVFIEMPCMQNICHQVSSLIDFVEIS